MDKIDRLLKVAAEIAPRPDMYDFSRLTTEELKEIVQGTSDERLEILVEKARR